MDALDTLDTQLGTNTAALAGQDFLITKIEGISFAEIRGLSGEIQIIAAAGANTIIECVSAFINFEAGGVVYADGEAPYLAYAGDTTAIFDFDAALFRSASCEVIRGTPSVDCIEIKRNLDVVLKVTTTDYTAGTGTADVYVIYRVISLTACPV